MLLIDDESRAALDGSRPADTLTAWAWYDGNLAWPDPLDINAWSISDSSGDANKVQRQVSLTVADPDGRLSPWLFDDPLGVGGVELQVIYRVGGAGAINVGWFRIVENAPEESFIVRTIPEYGLVQPDSPTNPHERKVMVPSGAVVQVTAVDRTANVDRDKLLAPESPRTATVISEVRRLVGDYMPVVLDPGVTDRSVARTLVYEKERLEAVQDLLAVIKARYRTGGDGELRVYPKAPGAPVWRVEPGAGLVNTRRKQTLDGLYNVWVVTGKDGGNGRPVSGTVYLTAGPLRVDGPHGRMVYEYSSEMISTYGDAIDYGETLRDQQARTLAVELEVLTIPRPEIQAGDRIEVGCPLAAGHVAYLPGEVTDVRAGGSPVPGPTQFTVSCAYNDVLAALSRNEWTQHLTHEKPELTWDRMPTNWGTAPEINWDELP